jgi:hypothetical protein
MQKFLIIAGLSLLIVGLLWPWLGKLPLGRLPGDIVVEREGFRFYFPVTTAVLLSLVATLLFWLFRR